MPALVQGRSALVLYGSETGNAQDIAEELGKLCERLRFNTQVSELDEVQIKDLLKPTVVLFAISTTGQGDLPANSQLFWRRIRSAKLPPGCLSTIRFASFGLGDSSYPQFNWAHRKLYNRIVQLGAQPICDRGESDEQHPEGSDGAFVPWYIQLRQHLLDHFPLPQDEEPIPDDELIEPKWILALDTAGNDLIPKNNPNPDVSSSHAPWQDQAGETVENRPIEGLLDLPNGLLATVGANARLTPKDHWQDVRHLALTLDQPRSYVPGDVLTIYPKNFPSDVDQFLQILGWTDVADSPVHFEATGNPEESGYPPPPRIHALQGQFLTLRSLLSTHLDIISIPRRSFFASLIHYTEDEFHCNRLKEFTDPQYIDELYDYTTRPRRSILEVLDEFTSLNIPWQRVCSIIPAMRGRQFSIASGGSLKTAQNPSPVSISNGRNPEAATNGSDTNATKIELLIAIVKYRTIIKRIRQGVATRYIADLQPGQQITVTLQKGSLGINKDQLQRPVIMIGPGTGVAPMRSLTHERQAWRKELADAGVGYSAAMPDMLFYGCRNRDADFFYKEEWEELEKAGHLKVFAAFSRDQRQKVYVQDVLREQKELLYSALVDHEGLVYVCGSSGKMPQAVREALLDALQCKETMDRSQAEAYFAKMEKIGRYKQETW